MAKSAVKKKAKATRKPARPAKKPAAKKKPAAAASKRRAAAPKSGAKARPAKVKKPAAAAKKSGARKASPARPAKAAGKRAARKQPAKIAPKPKKKPVQTAKPRTAPPKAAKPAAKRPAAVSRPVAVKPLPAVAVKPARPAAAKPARPVQKASPLVPPMSVVSRPAAPPPPAGPKPLRIRAKASVPATRTPVFTGPPIDLKQVLARLQAKKQEIQALYLNDLRSGQESNDSPTEDIVDRANNAYSRELNFSISDAERALMLQVDEAIRRVGDGSYANCANCGNPIARLRLEAVPWARYCISCQELLEQGMLSEA